MTAAARIRRLTLTDFRSYRTAQIDIDAPGPVVLTGPNGAGKTNLIESISFLTPGRGFRRATLEDVARDGGDGGWAVSTEIDGMLGLATLGTGIEPSRTDTAPVRRSRIDRESVTSAAAFADHLRIIWLVPAMDALFNGPASERRRFLDRLATSVDANHSGRVNAFDRALRSRNRLLETPNSDPQWLDAVERETAELAVAVAAGRAETVARLQAALAREPAADMPFPSAAIALDGWIESLLGELPATEIEDRYRAALRGSRARDAAAGRTLEGPHRSDLRVTHIAKNTPAADASTGEQKALLIRLVLAHAGLIADMTGHAPVLLLDEVVAHLDPNRRAALYDALAALGAQVFMTGADPAAFGDIAARASVFEVSPGTVARR
ncbi:MAG TPA: DNA replication/repair protein RecF [Pseudolabrys sp.]|nr:DNA replication/repair protein RecF [Pseudolabrys sp.]